MTKKTNEIVDKFLINKYLKQILFLLVIILLFLVLIIVLMLLLDKLCFSEIIAPFMIGISALLASTVAMINLRSTYINKIKDNTNDKVSEMRYLYMMLNRINDRLPLYKEILLGKKETNYEFLVEHEVLFQEYENIINNKTLIFYSNQEISTVLTKISHELFYIKANLKSVLKIYVNKSSELFYISNISMNIEGIDNMINLSEDLKKKIKKIDDDLILELNNIVKEESY